MKHLRRMTALVLVSAVALCTGTLVFALTCFVTGPTSWPPFGLTSGTGFTITSTISSSPTSQVAAVLYPGAQRYLWYTAHNPLTVPITVTSMKIATVRPPAGCPTSNLNYSSTTFLGSLVVPASGTNAVPVPISLRDTQTNQDSCENTTFKFVYTGTANYTDTTTTALTSSPNPSASGSLVTFTATVVPTVNPPSNPTGTVDFYLCETATCSSTTFLGSGSLGANGEAKYSTSSLKAGTDIIEAIYQGAPTDFSGSTSNTVSQVVTAPIATTTVLTSAPNPSGLGKPVTLTATVTKSSGSGTPTGTVNFYLGRLLAPTALWARRNVDRQGDLCHLVASCGHRQPLCGIQRGYELRDSTSPVISQVVVSLPSRCTGNYTNWFFGNPASPNITGTNGNDFIYAFGGNFRVNDFNGDDCCFYGGDGNNWLSDGNGNDVAIAGDGNNVFTLGNGNDQITVGNGTNTIGAGNGSDSVTVGNGNHNGITLGYGNDSVTVGSGSDNGVTLGYGTDSVTIQGGSYDTVNGGAGNETIYLGAGSYNDYNGAAHHTNICHLPAPPSSWHGTVAAYYNDTITNCTVVTP